jgi:hypothetical protein
VARIYGVGVDDLLADVDLQCGRTLSSRAHGSSVRRRLGQRLSTLRVRRGLGIWDVYLATGITGRRLRTIEAGADPSLFELRCLSTVLDVRLRDLLTGSRSEAHLRADLPDFDMTPVRFGHSR